MPPSGYDSCNLLSGEPYRIVLGSKRDCIGMQDDNYRNMSNPIAACMLIFLSNAFAVHQAISPA